MKSQMIECKLIEVPRPNTQFRSFAKDFAEKLADSIRVDGLIQPIVIRPKPDAPGRYVLVCGRHRHHAVAKILKQTLIAAIVRDDLDEASAEQLALAENLWLCPLRKSQHSWTSRRWYEFYMAWWDKAPAGSPRDS
jgi:ParB/RepB/Spo0J family partition protein